MPKFVSIEEAVKLIPDGATVMFGGFMGCGSAHKFIDALSKSGVKDLTVICNDGSMPGGPMGEDYYAVAKLIHNKQVKKLVATHVGLNPEVAQQNMQDKTLEVVLVPQGSLAEMIRADGAGLGGVLTPTGIGTDVERGKQRLIIDGKEYLLELPLHADVALIKATRADKAGNLQFRLTSRATNSYMAFAADTVIVEVEELVEVGELGPDEIDVPAPIVDMLYVRQGEKKPFCPMWKRNKSKAEAKAAKGGKK